MSAIEDDHSELLPADRDGFPAFELGYLFDNPDEPAEVTVFPNEGTDADYDLSTAWLTVDVDHAVPIEEVR